MKLNGIAHIYITVQDFDACLPFYEKLLPFFDMQCLVRNDSLYYCVGSRTGSIQYLPPVSDPDHVTVGLKVPNAVFCLISALAYHGMTTQIPHEIYIALPRGAEPPRLKYPPIRLFWFTGKAFTEGVETFEQDGANLKIYSPEKTLADCFKYRNKIGMDTVLEALKFYRQRKKTKIDQLLRYAQICRVEKVMRPYLEASL